MDDRLRAYLLGVGVRESDVLRRLREETATMAQARMQIAPEQGALLSMLVRLMGAARAIEIGVFTGYSALCVAEALADRGCIVACDVNVAWTDIARRYWQEAGVAHKIDLRLRPAAETLAGLLADGQAGTFDFAFIDADKGGYPVYFDRCLDLLRPGGLIAVDNVLWGGRVADPTDTDEDTDAIRAFNDTLRRDSRVDISVVPVGDGLTLARKK